MKHKKHKDGKPGFDQYRALEAIENARSGGMTAQRDRMIRAIARGDRTVMVNPYEMLALVLVNMELVAKSRAAPVEQETETNPQVASEQDG